MIFFSGCLAQTANDGNESAFPVKESPLPELMPVPESTDFNATDEAFPGFGGRQSLRDEQLQEMVAPQKGIVLPVIWGDVGVKAVAAGAIDFEKYRSLLERGGAKFSPEQELLFRKGSDANISFSPGNAYFNLNILWAIGLANRNPVLSNGRISDYGEDRKAGFASTGGWTLGKKSGGELLGSSRIIVLTPKQQEVVEEVAAHTFRPCCNNPTGFPDCNHGMAALALAELMAAQGASPRQIYDALLIANRYWFTQEYMNLARYLEENGRDFRTMDSRELLGEEYSSRKGMARVFRSLKDVPVAELNAVRCAL
ncbi:MAG: hypothetical protein HY917_02705 [Candidatus Diapherotrites archaeon]|nr:hypothetical protein [Candidatus Diapherotrites archaeon]